MYLSVELRYLDTIYHGMLPIDHIYHVTTCQTIKPA
jgi:hypothetical protein